MQINSVRPTYLLIFYCSVCPASYEQINGDGDVIVTEWRKVFTARCYARARLCHSILSVCLFVCPSVRDVEVCFHTGGNSLKIISRLNSLRPLLGQSGWPKHGPSGATGTPLKLGWNRGGSLRSTKNLQYLLNGARYDQGYYDGLIGSRIRTFDWYRYQNQSPWMTLNGQNVLSVSNVQVPWSHTG